MRIRFRFILLIPLIICLIVLNTSSTFAQDEVDPQSPDYEETYEGLSLCNPGVFLISPVDCLPMGPSQSLTQWAEKGMVLPLKPLSAAAPDASYLELEQKYAKLNLLPGVQGAFYPNLEAAISGWGALSTLPPGETLYIAYENVSVYQGKSFVQNGRGEWIRASPTVDSTFQGLLLNRPPANNFGWIIDLTNPRREPSYRGTIVNEKLNRGTVVQVYDQVEAEGTTWSMIGLGKWVERRAIRVVSPRLSPPEGVENGRWIEVNLYEQTLTAYENNRLKFATLVSTGFDPYFTQPGLFQITQKLDLETMEGSFESGKVDYYFLENVPWTMYYDGVRALHGAYWNPNLGYEFSHGCVNMSVGDSHWLYDWAEVDEWVYVWDPSGNTPTDPAFYQAGNAF